RPARRVRRDRAGRVGGAGRARRGRPGALRRRVRPHPAAVAEGVRGADLLLQDRHRVPVVALRAPAGVHDGGRAAVGPVGGAPVGGVRAGQRRPAVPGPRGGGRADAQPAQRGRGGAVTALGVPSGTPARVDTPAPGDARLARLSLNQRTTANWSLREAVEGAAAAGLPAIGLWREPVGEVGVETARRIVDDAGLRVSSLCRGGFFTASDPTERAKAHDDNLRALDEAAALGTTVLVLVPGGLPPGDKDLAGARQRAAEAVAALVPAAVERGVTLGIEPMNATYAAVRGVISTLAQALDIAEGFAPHEVGVVVDTFHLWWEPGVPEQLARAGERIVAYQVCDWITPLPADSLLA